MSAADREPTAPEAALPRMDIAVMGMMRSGSTLVADLLTVPGRSLVLNEPYLLDRWSAPLQERLFALYRGFGLDPGALPPPGRHARNQDHLVATILPQLAATGCLWGAKYADLHSWRRITDSYAPRRLILTLRDLRAVFLSGLDLLNRVRVRFGDERHRRDEAWLFAFIAYSVHELLALRRLPHLALRYEDLVRDAATRDALARHVGLDRLGEGRLNLDRHGERRAAWEREKHGDAITERSLRRFEAEPPGPMRSMAERLWRMFPDYSDAFGYETPTRAVRVTGHVFQSASADGENPIDYRALSRPAWRGPAGLEPAFGRRRARFVLAKRLTRPLTLLDLGCGTMALQPLLPKRSVYRPLDAAARSPEFRAADLCRGELPILRGVDLVVAFGLLEHVDDLPSFLRALRRYAVPVAASYYAAEDIAGLDVAAFGWRRPLHRAALRQAAEAAGFTVRARWAVDGFQSLLRLQPATARRAAVV